MISQAAISVLGTRVYALLTSQFCGADCGINNQQTQGERN